MKTAVVTGSTGLVGSETVEYLKDRFDLIIGIDNDLRQHFFGPEASTAWARDYLDKRVPPYRHHACDIREKTDLEKIFSEHSTDIQLVVHTAAQPSHDWAAKEPFTDFEVNANGTLNLLEMTRRHSPKAVFIFTSTNKVYGDTPNALPMIELETRWEVENGHRYAAHGIDESMTIDRSKHSLFGVSKLAADVMVQEYGKYFGMATGVFRCGCITGPRHSGTQLHGFLSYLVRCALTNERYTILGYKGKQVRDNIHSWDLVNLFWHFYQNPRPGEVYNIGGSRHSNCSILEAIAICEKITGKRMNVSLSDDARVGDHQWWISDVRKWKAHCPEWDFRYDVESTLRQIFEALSQRPLPAVSQKC